MDAAAFENEVGAAIDVLPAELRRRIANVAFGVEDSVDNANLLGLYRGVPLTARGAHYNFSLPDTITIYRLPILVRCATHQEVLDLVTVVVKHEIGHYFGIDDDRLHELGY